MFFAGWKLVGLGAGIGAAVVFGLVVFVHERRAGRPAAVVRLALVLVGIRAVVGIASGSATAYLTTEIGIDAPVLTRPGLPEDATTLRLLVCRRCLSLP
jgi:ABC-type Fe3+-siderophore transport system permease subunit